MQLHEALREVVDVHGRSVLADATGFRGVLDDVLAEDQASTGDINLLVDAVRFDALTPLEEMIDGGADPARAVEEAGARLSRDRGGSDQGPSSWASAVLGYAVGKVPEAVVLRYQSQRAPSSHLPPPSAAPPSVSPGWQQPPPTSAPPGSVPHPGSWPTGHPSSQPRSHPAAFSSQPSSPGGPQDGHAPMPYSSAPARGGRRSHKGAWIAGGVAAALVIVATAVGIGIAAGGDDEKKKDEPVAGVDTDPKAIDERYSTLSTTMTKGATDCAEGESAVGEAEVVECEVRFGKLRLVTHEDKESLTEAREERLDYQAGTLTADNGTTALYEYDPERGRGDDAAVIYWDSTSKYQSATITAVGDVDIENLVKVYQETSPRVSQPTSPAHPVLREFIDILMEVSGCTRQRTFFDGETEEDKCESGEDGIVVNVGRYSTNDQLVKDRAYYDSQYAKAKRKGYKGPWKLDDEEAGQYYGYLDEEGKTAVVYWDWNQPQCNCYGVAWNFDGKLKKLEDWWKRPRDDD